MPSEKKTSDRPSRRSFKPMWSPAPRDGRVSFWRPALRCPLWAAKPIARQQRKITPDRLVTNGKRQGTRGLTWRVSVAGHGGHPHESRKAGGARTGEGRARVSLGCVQSVMNRRGLPPTNGVDTLHTSMLDFFDTLMLDGWNARFSEKTCAAPKYIFPCVEGHRHGVFEGGTCPARKPKTVASCAPCTSIAAVSGGQGRPLPPTQQLRRNPALPHLRPSEARDLRPQDVLTPCSDNATYRCSCLREKARSRRKPRRSTMPCSSASPREYRCGFCSTRTKTTPSLPLSRDQEIFKKKWTELESSCSSPTPTCRSWPRRAVRSTAAPGDHGGGLTRQCFATVNWPGSETRDQHVALKPSISANGARCISKN